MIDGHGDDAAYRRDNLANSPQERLNERILIVIRRSD